MFSRLVRSRRPLQERRHGAQVPGALAEVRVAERVLQLLRPSIREDAESEEDASGFPPSEGEC